MFRKICTENSKC